MCTNLGSLTISLYMKSFAKSKLFSNPSSSKVWSNAKKCYVGFQSGNREYFVMLARKGFIVGVKNSPYSCPHPNTPEVCVEWQRLIVNNLWGDKLRSTQHFPDLNNHYKFHNLAIQLFTSAPGIIFLDRPKSISLMVRLLLFSSITFSG